MSVWEHHLYQRLESIYIYSPSFSVHANLRTRLIRSSWLDERPGYDEQLKGTEGVLPLSTTLLNRNTWFLHSELDRMYGDWSSGKWTIRAGRQRINWGISIFTNPHDIFNIHSPYDLFYPEKPGTDAIRIQYFPGSLSRLEIAYSPGTSYRRTTAGARYQFHHNGYDLHLLTGLFRERFVAGIGWAGQLGLTGFKGEWSWFEDLPGSTESTLGHWAGSISLDHLFSSSLYLLVEGVYNASDGVDPARPNRYELRPDNPSLSSTQFLLQGQWTRHPLYQPGVMTGLYPADEALFLAPSLQLSLLQDLDLQIVSQLFFSSSDTFSSRGRSLYASLSWNF
ncbi:MAG: hypothetical protein ACQER4_01470 [Bacteroidota bacterium]